MDLCQLEYSRKSLRAAHSPRQRRNCTWCSLCQLFDTGSGHLSGLVANGRVCRFAISPITKRYLTEGPLPMRWYQKSRIRSEPCQARWRERPLPQSWGAKIVMETAPGKTCLRCAPRHQGRSRQPGDGDRTRAKSPHATCRRRQFGTARYVRWGSSTPPGMLVPKSVPRGAPDV